MASISGGDGLTAKLRELGQKIRNATEVRVGFLEGATYPDGTSVAMVAAIQNFGAPGAGIPPRPFFSNMVADKSPEWGEKFGRVLKAADYDAGLALDRMGEGIAGQLRQAIVETNDPPLSPETIRRKGGTATAAKPLVDTGHMLASVDKEVE